MNCTRIKKQIICCFTILFFSIFLLGGCKCDKTCKKCYSIRKIDYEPFPLTAEQLTRIRSTNWENIGGTHEVLPLDKLKNDIKVFQNYLLLLEIYYRQSSSVIRINRKDIVRKKKDGLIFLYNRNGQILNGVYVFALHKNFYVIIDIKKGLPDGACILFYYIPSLSSYASGYYKNGKPINGTFPYIYESDLLLPYAFFYYKGVLVTLSTNKLVSFPFLKNNNMLSTNGKIINGYDLACPLKDVKLSDKILFKYYQNLQYVKSVELKEIEKNLTFLELFNLYQAMLDVISSNKWSPKDWR